MLPVILEVLPLLLLAAGFYMVVLASARRMRPHWSVALEERRLVVLAITVLALIAWKVAEIVVGERSHAFDTAVLLALNEHVPPAMVRFFGWVTLTGSSVFLTAVMVGAVLMMLFRRHRTEALLAAASGITGALTVYFLKLAFGRERPALWETIVHSTASFPSGHTLGTATCALALALCMRRIWPQSRFTGLWLALLWLCLVGASRLVLGVHWPTDVLAAACIGLAIPLLFNLILDIAAQPDSPGIRKR